MAVITASISSPLFADNEIEALRLQLDEIKNNYEQRIQALEARLQKAENNLQNSLQNNAQNNLQNNTKQVSTKAKSIDSVTTGQNSFNPAISLIMDGRYASFDNNPEAYELPGFALGNEAGLAQQGIGLGHSELAISANIDDKFYGKTTIALHEHEGETEVELEEAYIQSLGLGNGLTLKAGRFYSMIGYLNEQHEHVWDFSDAPLIYRGLFGNQLRDDGLQMTYIAPTDTFLQLGIELFSGRRFPAGGEHDGIGSWSVFANTGGDIGIEHSWQLGLSHWQSNDINGLQMGIHATRILNFSLNTLTVGKMGLLPCSIVVHQKK